MNEPVLTWNLFLTAGLAPLSVAILGGWINRKANQREEGWKKYYALKEQEEERRSKDLKETLTCIRSAVHQKVDKTEFVENKEAVWKRVNDHAHTIDCKGHDCTAKETGKVIITGC